MREKDYIDTKTTLDKFRKLNKNTISKMLVEDSSADKKETDTNGAIPYTKEDPAMTNIIETATAQFGADFSDNETSMFYYPPTDSNTFDIVLTGRIPKLNNCKFEFRYQGGTEGGCRIWCDPLTISEDSQNTIKKIYAVFDNWRNEVNHEDVKPLSIKN